MAKPWDDWIPGVLNPRQMQQLFKEGLIQGISDPKEAFGRSAIDLYLSDEAYLTTQGSVKPSSTLPYGEITGNKSLCKRLRPSAEGEYVLKAKKTYVFRLKEVLDAKRLANLGIYGGATAKSSVGRVDVLARLIVDGMDTFEGFDPKKLRNGNGSMYLEITPITFFVKVKAGIPLSQLRLFYGKPSEVRMRGDKVFLTTLRESATQDGSLSVDLSNDKVGGLPVAAFCAIKNSARDPIPLWDNPNDGSKPKPWNYWQFKSVNNTRHLKIEKNDFYILRSKEKMALPPSIAIYCRASDETIGEMRIHYAGFVHPLFGRLRRDRVGTPLMFEVRGHQVDVSLADGEKLANLVYYRMSQDVREKKSGKKATSKSSDYETQTLKLSNFFGKWPQSLRWRDNDGTVEPE